MRKFMANFSLVAAAVGISTFAFAQDREARTTLPLSDVPTGGKAGLTVKESVMPTITPIRPPEGAPNIVIVLLDDVGFGATGTFGGVIPTPETDKLASEGLSYTRFHTTALCSPSRAALLTGRNHHVVNTGNITEYATGFDGYNSIIPKSAATVAQVLRENGYSTAAFGKWHNTPVWELGPTGPFDRWPTGLGFEEFYGFMGGEAHQYQPGLFHGTTPYDIPQGTNYYMTTDLVDRALDWMKNEQSVTPDKPFFVYWAPGATHAPHHVSEEWIKPFEGKFDDGWDKLREKIFANQKAKGIVPADTVLTPRDESVPAWSDLSPERKKIAARLMEVYAGFLAKTDHEIGRLAQGIKDMGAWENTLFVYIIGDNGGAPAGGIYGVFNEIMALNGLKEDPAVVLSRIDQFGGPKANNEYPVGFSWAMNTPFQFTKQVASHLGGTRNPLIIDWPARIKDKGGRRTQYHHVIDIMPTILEAAGVPAPTSVDGVKQKPLDGVSLTYSFDNRDAAGTRTRQYYEIAATRAIYDAPWLASTYHGRLPWKLGPSTPFENDTWELYNLDTDFSQGKDLASENPAKLDELKKIFLEEAKANSVLPLDDRGPMRAVGARPSILGDRTSITFGPTAQRMPEDIIRSAFNRSYSIEAVFDPAKNSPTQGVVLASGGYFGGLSLHVSDGKPAFTYNYFGSSYTTIAADTALPATGAVTLRFDFDYEGGTELGKGGTGRLFVDGKQVAEGKIAATVPVGFSADETLDVGVDTGTPASDTYSGPEVFTGSIVQVQLSLR